MKLSEMTDSQLAEMIGDTATNEIAGIFRAYLERQGVDNTRSVDDRQWLTLIADCFDGKSGTVADRYIGLQFTSIPEDEFYADGISASVDGDDGQKTYFVFSDGSTCAVTINGECIADDRGNE